MQTAQKSLKQTLKPRINKRRYCETIAIGCMKKQWSEKGGKKNKNKKKREKGGKALKNKKYYYQNSVEG